MSVIPIPDIIKIPFDPTRTTRDQIEATIAATPPLRCPRHSNEILPVEIKATIQRAMHHEYPYEERPYRAEFSATYNRCSDCPHSVVEHEIDVENCAVAPMLFGRRRLSAYDKDRKPLPTHFGSASLVADQSARQQFDSWLKGEFRCPFHNQPLQRIDARWKLPFESWHIEPQFTSCLQCGLERLGISPDEAHASFENLIVDPPELQGILDKCRAFAAKPQGVLLLLGNVGTAKTHLAIAILRERLRMGKSDLVFIKHRHFLARHWLAMRPVAFREEPPESPLACCQSSPLLVYDELSPATDSRIYEDVLLDLFEKRIGDFKPSIITANLNPGELEAAIGSRLVDRLRRVTFAVLEFGFESKRKSLNAGYLDRSRTAVRS